MSRRVLMVEDNALNLELQRDLLEAAGDEVTVATTAAEFRELMAGGLVPDVVLLDILLPDGFGTQLLDELRRLDRVKNVPVLAITAQALFGDVPRLLAAGFDAVITKPIDTRTFGELVAHCVRRQEESP